jgi:hypothetical protein
VASSKPELVQSLSEQCAEHLEGMQLFKFLPLCCITAVLNSVSPVATNAVRTCVGNSLRVKALDSFWICWLHTRIHNAHLDDTENNRNCDVAEATERVLG